MMSETMVFNFMGTFSKCRRNMHFMAFSSSSLRQGQPVREKKLWCIHHKQNFI